MNWVVFTILAVSFRAIYGIATRVLTLSVKVSPMSQAVLLTGFATILSLVLSPFLGGMNFSHLYLVWIPLVISIASSTLGNIVYFKGQETLDAGTTQIAFSSIVIWGAVLSFGYLGSHFSFIQIFGIFLLLFAIILVQYKKSQYTLSVAVLYILGSAFIFSIFQVASAQVSRALPAGTALPIGYFGSTVIVAALYRKKLTHDFQAVKGNYKNVIQKGFFASGSTLLYYLSAYIAYSLAPDRGIVVVLLPIQAIIAVFLGIVFLKERDRMPQKIIAGIMAVVASILIEL